MADRMGQEAGQAHVDAYIVALDPSIRPVFEAVRDVVCSAAPEARETLKWGFPSYVQNRNVCSIMPGNGYVRRQFFQGAALSNPDRLLEGAGKNMRHVKVTGDQSLPRATIRALMLEVAVLASGG